MSQSYTPVPWARSSINDRLIGRVDWVKDEVSGTTIPMHKAVCIVQERIGETSGNADLIVKAVNCHYDFLYVVRYAYAHCDPTPGHEQEWDKLVNEVLKKAEVF